VSDNSFGHVQPMTISAVIPAHNEADSIGDIIRSCKDYCAEIIVVDDGSTDETSRVAQDAGAIVIQNQSNLGVVRTTEIGLRAATGDIIVTLDADGQHDPSEIPDIVEPIKLGLADLVLGKRNIAPPVSERLLARIVGVRVKCDDIGTGYRALRRGLAQRVQLWGFCLCGSLVLEAYWLGGRIVEVPTSIRPRRFRRSHWSSRFSRARVHSKQAVLLLGRILKETS
jgi:glycosyltransferase involved in cell wall biosynthesis